MFCQKCGTQNPDNGKFCRNCGTNLAPVSGNVSEKIADMKRGFGMIEPVQPIQPLNFRYKKVKPVNCENAITKLFTGAAFLVIAIVLAFTQAGNGWWFWMLIPAFGAIGSGVAQLTHQKKTQDSNNLITGQETNRSSTANSNAALPSPATEYVQPQVQKTIYDTGDLVAPPSIVEGTTMHLEINKEGDTMTLPERGKWKM